MIGLLLCFADEARVVPVPPPMPKRAIVKREGPLPGETIEMEDGDRKFTLFIPSACRPAKHMPLRIHFHSAVWQAVQEHLDAGGTCPIVVFNGGQGSSAYAKPFEDEARIGRWLRLVAEACVRRGAPKDARVASLSISSFSAGYGAVRQLVQDPAVFKLIKRVVLLDSMYGSLDPASAAREPLRQHIACWQPLAEAAMRGEKTFCVTFSQVPTPAYASSLECAEALVRVCGGELRPVERGACAATLDADFPLAARFDKGRFHVWGYAGSDAEAHMTHARHLADVWKALDLVRSP